MAWWVWALTAWAAVSVAIGVVVAGAMRRAEHDDWVRRGRPERRRDRRPAEDRREV